MIRHNGQPAGAQSALTTEDGSYTLNGATFGVSVSKNVEATVWIPSESEWYKAAYYDPTKGGAGGYWQHANQSDTLTSNDPTVAGAANYHDGDYAETQSSNYSFSQNYLTKVGAYGLDSESYYGTNDQAGNVFEWNDAVIISARGLRGGTWDNNFLYLPASYRGYTSPTNESDTVGFRVAGIPEPSAIMLTLLAVGASLARSRRSSL